MINGMAQPEADHPLAPTFVKELENRGYVPNYLELFALRPAVYEAWAQLNGAVRANMDLRRYELATLAAAQALRSSYCSLAHGLVLRDKVLDEEELALAIKGEPKDQTEREVMSLARQVALDATKVEESDLDSLRALGLGDDEIFDVILTGAMRAFFSKTLDAAGLRPDRQYRDLLGPELVSQLAVGRPVED